MLLILQDKLPGNQISFFKFWSVINQGVRLPRLLNKLLKSQVKTHSSGRYIQRLINNSDQEEVYSHLMMCSIGLLNVGGLKTL